MSRRKDALFIVSMALARSFRTERGVGLEMGLESVQNQNVQYVMVRAPLLQRLMVNLFHQ